MNNETQRDEQLWQTAKARVAFRWSFASYLIVNTFLIGIWYFTSGNMNHFWPIWPILGWGIGIAFHYVRAYHGEQVSSVEAEYNKLKNQSNN